MSVPKTLPPAFEDLISIALFDLVEVNNVSSNVMSAATRRMLQRNVLRNLIKKVLIEDGQS